MCYELAMRYVIRPVASLQELTQVFDLVGAQLPRRLTRRDRRFTDLARHFPADRSLMLVAEDQGRIAGAGLPDRPCRAGLRRDPAAHRRDAGVPRQGPGTPPARGG
jgi:hypothetical protein